MLMRGRIVSSRQRFKEYREKLRSRRYEPVLDDPTGKNRRPRVRSTGTLLKEFFRLLRPERKAISLSLLTLTISTLLGLIPPASTKFIVDNVLSGRPLPSNIPGWLRLPTDRWQLMIYLVTGVTLLSVVQTAVHIWGRWNATQATKRLQLLVRKQVFAHAVRLPLHRVYHLKSGGVASILREDAGSVGELVFGLLYNPWRAIIQLLGSLCILAWVDWRLLLGGLVIVPMVFITHRTWINRIRPQYRDIRSRRTQIDSQATETFGGMRVVRAFGRQRSETGRFMRNNNVMGRQELHVWWWARIVEIVWEIAIPLGTGALMLYGGWQVLSGNLTLGDLMMFLVYLLMLLRPLAMLAESATAFQNSLSAFDRVLDLLEEPREMPSGPGSVKVEKAQVAGRITLQNVSFQYSGKTSRALNDVSIDVQPGQTIAVVGPSGAGKTTICNLVARFYDPTEGAVLLDGRDLREIDVESYRNLLGVVEQDVFLFDGTIAENIGYGNRHARAEEIVRAAEIANALEFIRELPQEFETLIGERGVKLSGGQRQRIAIARAVLADPRILILDEATSNLDTESERLIQSSLSKLMQDRTSFVIAHRLSTIARADRILVLENGSLVEFGTHDNLMEMDSRYREMVLLQINMQRNLTSTVPA